MIHGADSRALLRNMVNRKFYAWTKASTLKLERARASNAMYGLPYFCKSCVQNVFQN